MMVLNLRERILAFIDDENLCFLPTSYSAGDFSNVFRHEDGILDV